MTIKKDFIKSVWKYMLIHCLVLTIETFYHLEDYKIKLTWTEWNTGELCWVVGVPATEW